MALLHQECSRTSVPLPHGRRFTSESGQNLVEMAFLMPLVLGLIGAVIMFSFALHARSSLQQGVREGARQAAVGKPLAEVQTLASGNAADVLDPSDVHWCLPSGSDGDVGDTIRVFVDEGNNGSEGYSVDLIPSTGIFDALGVDDLAISMSPRATARLEKSVSGVPPCV